MRARPVLFKLASVDGVSKAMSKKHVKFASV
jgi:hypothetical protein